MSKEIVSPAPRFSGLATNTLLLTVTSFLLSAFSLELVIVSKEVSPLWLPTAMMTIIAFRARARHLPLYLGGCMAAQLSADVLFTQATLSHLSYALPNFVQMLLGGWLLRRLLNRHCPLDTLADWCKMALAIALFTPCLSGLLLLMLPTVADQAAARVYFSWLLAETTGTLALAPVCLLWPTHQRRPTQWPKRLPAILLTFALSLLLCAYSLAFLPWPFTFVILIFFTIAVRLPQFVAYLLFFSCIVLMSLMLTFNLVDLYGNTSASILKAPWFPLLLTLIPSQIMTQVMQTLRKEQIHIRESETRFRLALDYSAIGMSLISLTGYWLKVNPALCRLLGYHADELQRMTFMQLSHPDDRKTDQQHFQQLLAGKGESYSMEKRYLRKDGGVVQTLLAMSVVRDSENRPLYCIAQIEDITALKNSEETNRQLTERVTLANEAGGIGVWEWDRHHQTLNWDKRMFALYQQPLSKPPHWRDLLHQIVAADRFSVMKAIIRAQRQRTMLDVEFRITSPKGLRYLHVQAKPVYDTHGQLLRMTGVCQDISELRRLNNALWQEKERMLITLGAIGEAVISTDKKMCVSFMNPVAEKISAHTQAQARGMPLAQLLMLIAEEPYRTTLHRQLTTLPTEKISTDLQQDLLLQNRHGERFDINFSITPLTTPAEGIIGSVMIIREVSESRNIMKNLSYSASHDALTRLPNRRCFEQKLASLLLSASQQCRQHVLVFIDLDHFKQINDTAGHAAGDALLRELATLMSQQLSHDDFLARLGGDEFGLLCANRDVVTAYPTAQKLVTLICQYIFIWDNQPYQVGASAGITLIDHINCHSSSVMSQADVACYNAKHLGRGQISLYKPQQQYAQHAGMSVTQSRHVLADHSMRLVAWAVAPPGTTQSTRFFLTESLLSDAAGRELEGQQFRDERQGVDVALSHDHQLLTLFFNDFARQAAQKALTFCLPLSAISLRDSALCQALQQYLQHSPLPASALWIRIDIDAYLQHSHDLQNVIHHFRQMGCRFLLDNVGGNLAAFDRFSASEFNYLILSPSLIDNLHCNLMDEMLVSIIKGHAQRKNIDVIGGPVTLPRTLTLLKTIGIDGVWGNLIASRIPLSSLIVNSYFAIR